MSRGLEQGISSGVEIESRVCSARVLLIILVNLFSWWLLTAWDSINLSVSNCIHKPEARYCEVRVEIYIRLRGILSHSPETFLSFSNIPYSFHKGNSLRRPEKWPLLLLFLSLNECPTPSPSCIVVVCAADIIIPTRTYLSYYTAFSIHIKIYTSKRYLSYLCTTNCIWTSISIDPFLG